MKIAFFTWLDGMMDKVDPKYFTGKLQALRPGEEVIGSVPEPLRRMYAVSTDLKTQVTEVATALQLRASLPGFVLTDADRALVDELNTKSIQAEFIKDLFWAALRHETNFHKGTIGIRGDWDAVSMPDHPDGSLFGALLHI